MVGLAQFDLAPALGHAGLAHAFDDMLLPCQENRVVALLIGAETPYRESRIERQSDPGLGLRLVQLTEIREGGGEKEMGKRPISIELDTAAEPRDGLLVGPKSQLGAHPP